ncbi:IgG-binding virulence factor TspB family protein [Neisseria sp. P0012.S006]|uniref:IgG-binding virulence factor TspB family protein n=1 Tax=Neisseria sp. P0012.S006 TaxID=3436732 RepID=UPI003F809460
MNDTRNLFYSRRFALRSRLLVLVCFSAQVLSPLTAFAEVGLPPPVQHQNAGFPSDQALQRRGYDPKTGVWKVDVQNNGKPTITKNGSDFSGSQGKNVTVTGRYGETGTMNTTVNQRVGTGRLQTAANTVIVANAVNNSYTKNYAAEAAKAFKNGDYLQAAHNSIMTLGATLDGILGGAIRDIATGIGNGLKQPQQYEQAQRQAEAEGNYQKAVAQAAAKKAAEAAQKAKAQQEKKENLEKQEKSGKNVVLVRFREWGGGEAESVEWKSYETSFGVGRSDYGNYHLYDMKNSSISIKYSNDLTITYSPKFTGKYGRFLSISTYPNSELNRQNIINNNDSVDINDFMLTQKEMLDILKRMLENNQTNHAELMNQLAKMGVMNQSAEPSTFSPDTALSAPYTPEGSSTPQQTRFRMNQDGTVGVDYVPRPDLKPNSPEAPNKPEKTTPSRQESPDTPNAPNSPNSPNTPNEPNSPNSPNNQQTPNQKENGLCSMFPNIAACADMGNAEEKDLNIPQNDQDIGTLKPLEHFKTDGVCPKPQSFDFGLFGRFEMGYDTICDIARKIRPILILICMISCSWAAWSAVKEL